MKKHIATLTALALCCLLNFPAAGFAKTPSLVINNKVVQSDVPPQISNGRVLVPLRVISESMGASVTWNGKSKQIYISANQKVLKLQLNNKIAYVGSQALTLDAPPQLIKDRTFVPLRFIGESLDSEVTWDGQNSRVVISQTKHDSYLPKPADQPKQFNNPRTLSDISYREVDNQTIIDLKVKAGSNKIMKLSNPDRLVIDLADTTKATGDSLNINTNLVAAVRIGQFNDTTTRVVLDLKNFVTYEAKQSGDNLTITLKEGVNEQPAPQPATNDNSIYANKTINPDSNIVVVDAGHGGQDVGAIGVSGRYEKDINLNIALKLKAALEAKGFQVVMTRDHDTFVSLPGIVEIANNANPFAFVSIHANKAGSAQATGVETYTFYGTDRTLANLVENSIVARTKQTNRGVKEAGFYVIKYTKVPAVLVETGFISNPAEENFLFDDNNQTTIANAIADAVAQFKVSLRK